ncbi:MAG: hypothetical protein Q4D99_00070 [Bacillota bacterium]|nr:hypothetical protein [Bacillota bacterium]
MGIGKIKRHRYYRLSDGRLIDVTNRKFREYRDGRWRKPSKPVTFNMIWFAKSLENMKQVKECAGQPDNPYIHFHGRPCCLFALEKDVPLNIRMLNDSMELIADYGRSYNDQPLHPGDDGDRTLLRCKSCGALFVRVSWETHSFSDFGDKYYDEWYQVNSQEQAEKLLEILPGGMMAGFDGPHFMSRADSHEVVGVCAESYL